MKTMKRKVMFMRCMMYGGAVALGMACLAGPVLPALAADKNEDGGTLMVLSAEARRTVTQDRVTATLSFEKQAKTAAEAQGAVNAAMQAAKAVYAVPGVKAATGAYNVWKNYPADPQPRPAATPEEREKGAFWQASQQLTLDSADRDTLLKLVGTLQRQGFAVQGLSFYLSREARDALKDELAVEALGTIRERAQLMARTLGMRDIRYARIDLSGADAPRPPMPMMARAMKAEAYAADAALPVAQPDDAEVAVTVTAEVKLR